jgi:hypothetical protein
MSKIEGLKYYSLKETEKVMSDKFTVMVKKVPLYPCRLGVIVSNDEEEINKYLKGHEIPYTLDLSESYGYCIGQGVYKDEKGKKWSCCWVIVPPNDEMFTHGLIAHEVRHATNSILDYIGHKLDAKNDEPEAYLSQWITDVVYKAIEESGNLGLVSVGNV